MSKNDNAESDAIEKARIRQSILSRHTNPKLTPNACTSCFNTALIHATKELDGFNYTFAFVCPFCHSNDLWNYRQVDGWNPEKHEREGYKRLRA